jgi:hypothetical protein
MRDMRGSCGIFRLKYAADRIATSAASAKDTVFHVAETTGCHQCRMTIMGALSNCNILVT